MTKFKAFRAVMAPALVAVLFFLLTPVPSMAGENALNLPPAPFKPVAVGTKMTWKETSGDKSGELVITGLDGMMVKSTWEGNDRTRFILCMWCTSRGAEIDVKAYASLWPLTVGKSMSIDRVSGRGSWTNEITVTGTEKVKLDFGTVDAYRVVSVSTSHSGSSWSANRVYWYAPAFGYTVKYEHSDDNRSYAWEAATYTKP